MRPFFVTYEIFTPESVEQHADAAERGFVAPGEWHQEAREPLTLRQAIALIGCCEDQGDWFTETDGRQNYRTGSEERRALHPPANITSASYARLCRLLGC